MKFLSNLSTKKFSIILGLFIVLAIIGGVLLYISNPKIKFVNLANSEYKSFASVIDSVKNSELSKLSKDNTLTLAGSASFNLSLNKDMFNNSLDSLVDVVNKLNIDYLYGSDPKSSNTYLKLNSDVSGKDLLDMEVYQKNDKKYIYYNNVFDKYIESDSTTYLNSNGNQATDIEYLIDKIKASLFSSLKTTDFKTQLVSIEINGENVYTNKITLTLNDERAKEILKNILTDIRNDQKCLDILNNLNPEDKNIKESIDESIKEIDKEKIIDKDLIISIYAKNNNVVKLEVYSDTTKIIQYLNYVGIYKTKEITISDDQKILINAIFEFKSLNDISYKVSFNNDTIGINGSITKNIINTTAHKEWDANLVYTLGVLLSQSEVGNLKIQLSAVAKIGDEIKMPDITNIVKESDLTSEEKNSISSKMLQIIQDAIPVNLPGNLSTSTDVEVY